MTAVPMLTPAPDLAPHAETSLPNAPCAHESRRFLGTDRTAHFYRCDSCGAVLILQRDHLWVLHAAQTP